MRWRVTFMILFAVLSTGCEARQAAQPASASGVEHVQFDGKMTYVDLEGGFWGIVGDDGRHYLPNALADKFRREGLRVRVSARPDTETMGIQMWGTRIDILTIEAR